MVPPLVLQLWSASQTVSVCKCLDSFGFVWKWSPTCQCLEQMRIDHDIWGLGLFTFLSLQIFPSDNHVSICTISYVSTATINHPYFASYPQKKRSHWGWCFLLLYWASTKQPAGRPLHLRRQPRARWSEWTSTTRVARQWRWWWSRDVNSSWSATCQDEAVKHRFFWKPENARDFTKKNGEF